MTRTDDSDVLEDRLVRTLQAKATQVQPRDSSFDPTVVPLDVAADREHRRVRVALIAAALVAAIVAVSTTVVVTRRSSGRPAPPAHPSPDHVATPRVLPAVDGPALVPVSPPAGMQLWSVRTTGGAGGGAARSQLFGTVDVSGSPARALLVELSPGGGGHLAATQSVRVRGHDAIVADSKDGGAATRELDWTESGVFARVLLRGVTPAEAATALNRLRPRSANLLDGFDPTSARAGFGLLGEMTAGDAGSGVALGYGAGPPSPGGAPEAVMLASLGASYPGYLRTWIAGSRGADGVATSVDPGYDVVVAWPDGRQIVVETAARDTDTIARSADTAVLLGVDALRSLRADVDRRLAALPLIGAADLASGRLELRGRAGPQALCLRVLNAAPTCTAAEAQLNAAWEAGLASSAEVDGRWTVYAASPSLISLTRGTPFPSRRQPGLPAASTAVAGWNLVLATVPDGIDNVLVSVWSGNQSSGETLTRPRA
jgi:hypothetical protein